MASVGKIKIKKGDKVIVLKGRDRGKIGKVVKVSPGNRKLTVDGLNLFKKTIRATRQGERGQVVDKPFPLEVANVQLVCPSCNKATRIGSRVIKDRKERYCKKCEAKI
ncbi:MAG: 50S ribosomal protein L24 [Candidatus Colwellbacteria bacterium]|nr:50S ribosomal protein L24 [Candidatus Colwellbacteria bacterium]